MVCLGLSCLTQRNRRGQLERGGGVFFSAGNECLSAASFISKAKNTPPPLSIPHNPQSGATSRPRMPYLRPGHKEREHQAKHQSRDTDTKSGHKRTATIEPLLGQPRPDHLGEAVEGHHGGRQTRALVGMKGAADALGEKNSAQKGAS